MKVDLLLKTIGQLHLFVGQPGLRAEFLYETFRSCS